MKWQENLFLFGVDLPPVLSSWMLGSIHFPVIFIILSMFLFLTASKNILMLVLLWYLFTSLMSSFICLYTRLLYLNYEEEEIIKIKTH